MKKLYCSLGIHKYLPGKIDSYVYNTHICIYCGKKLQVEMDKDIGFKSIFDK